MVNERRKLVQYAPWPTDLEDAVVEFRYLDEWVFSLVEMDRDFEDADGRSVPIAGGLTFLILVPCFDAYHPEVYRPVHHLHIVPAATFNRAAWERWIVDRLLDTLRHEACEHARFERTTPNQAGMSTAWDNAEVRRPFAPTHGPGDDPYVLHEYASEQQRRTSFRGKLNPSDPG